MLNQLNILLQRLTGFKLKCHGKYVKQKTCAELGYHHNLGTHLIAKAYISTPLVDTKDQALDKSAPYYYLDLYLKTLPKDKQYLILEHCADTILTHRVTETEILFSYSEMISYVKAIFLPEYPHRLAIRPY